MFGKKEQKNIAGISVLTIPNISQVVEKYVSKDEIVVPEEDFSAIDDEIRKNKKIIDFLYQEKREAFDNEKGIFSDEMEKYGKRNKELEMQKIIARKRIEADKKGYPRIDLSFLSLARPVTGRKLSNYPVFSVHKYHRKEFYKCRINLERGGISVPDKSFSIFIFKKIIRAFLGSIKETDIKIERGYQCLKWRKEGKYFIDRDTYIESHFEGLIPQRIKDKIEEALPIFSDEVNTCGIYLIRECHDWKEREITRDPLLIGVLGDEARYLSHFDTTDLEDRIREKFVE